MTTLSKLSTLTSLVADLQTDPIRGTAYVIGGHKIRVLTLNSTVQTQYRTQEVQLPDPILGCHMGKSKFELCGMGF